MNDIDHEVTRCALTAAVLKVERETQETLAVVEYERQECGKARTPRQAALGRLANGLQGYAVSLKTLRDQLQSADLSSGASRRELLYPVFIEASACIDTAQAWRKETADTIKEQVRRLDDAASSVPVDPVAAAATGQPPQSPDAPPISTADSVASLQATIQATIREEMKSPTPKKNHYPRVPLNVKQLAFNHWHEWRTKGPREGCGGEKIDCYVFHKRKYGDYIKNADHFKHVLDSMRKPSRIGKASESIVKRF